MTGCARLGCDDRPHHARGLCRVHYDRALKYARPQADRDASPEADRPERVTLLAEVDHLRESGESPAAIARRLDRKPSAIARAYRRAGRPTEARVFEREATKQQRNAA